MFFSMICNDFKLSLILTVEFQGTETLMVLPLMIMGGLMVVGGFFALMLPETLHHHLPQTLQEGEEFGKHFGFRQWLMCPVKVEKDHQEQDEQQVDAEAQQLEKYVAFVLFFYSILY